MSPECLKAVSESWFFYTGSGLVGSLLAGVVVGFVAGALGFMCGVDSRR